MDIHFLPIDLDHDFDHCLAFRRDSYFCSFETLQGFEESIVGYRERIGCRMNEGGWFYVHIWNGGEIIGQLEFRSFLNLPSDLPPDLQNTGPETENKTGYVHLVYLVPQYRGTGLAARAEGFIAETLQARGCQQAILSVSRSNQRAIKHYQRHGWRYLKPNPKHATTDFYLREFQA